MRARALLLVALASCKTPTRESPAPPAPSASADPSALALAPPAPPPAAPKGMVWIPPGVLLAGTPEGKLPRVADAEMAGEQVVLRGFFIDELPYPNEAGAIPRGNVSQVEAAALCAEQEKRLCSELEWERACKGPQNFTYPYGDTYRASECGTGVRLSSSMPPAGILPGCRSGFGVRDLSGGVFEWTDSPWGRGTLDQAFTMRGGNALAGDVVARCANGIGRAPRERAPEYGFRCCKGERNLAEVTINVVHGEGVKAITVDDQTLADIAAHPPPEMEKRVKGASWKHLMGWRWRPIGNEELVLVSGCTPPTPNAECGIVVGRRKDGAWESLAYGSSGWWLPALHEDADPRDLFVFGGDGDGGFRRAIGYAWGRVVVGEPERKIPKKKRKKRHHDEP